MTPPEQRIAAIVASTPTSISMCNCGADHQVLVSFDDLLAVLAEVTSLRTNLAGADATHMAQLVAQRETIASKIEAQAPPEFDDLGIWAKFREVAGKDMTRDLVYKWVFHCAKVARGGS